MRRTGSRYEDMFGEMRHEDPDPDGFENNDDGDRPDYDDHEFEDNGQPSEFSDHDEPHDDPDAPANKRLIHTSTPKLSNVFRPVGFMFQFPFLSLNEHQTEKHRSHNDGERPKKKHHSQSVPQDEQQDQSMSQSQVPPELDDQWQEEDWPDISAAKERRTHKTMKVEKGRR